MKNTMKRITSFAIAVVLCLLAINWSLVASATVDTNTGTEDSSAGTVPPTEDETTAASETMGITAPARQSYRGKVSAQAADGSSKEVTVIVEADEDAFPQGASLSVALVPANEHADVDDAVEEKRAGGSNVAMSYTFDITMRDAEGAALQPADGKNVTLSFSMEEVANNNLDTRVYHIQEVDSPASLCVTPLDVETKGKTATVTTEGFSYYTVEFTYGNLQYVLPGDGTVALQDILTAVGISGKVSAVEVSDSTLFSAANAGGVWTVTAHRAFSTTEWLKVTIGGLTYEITVTDATIVQSGTLSSSVTWELDSDGQLTIRPTTAGSTGYLPSATGSGFWNENTPTAQILGAWPYLNYRSDIKSVVIQGEVQASSEIRHMFNSCTELTSVDLSGLTAIGQTITNDMFRNCSKLTEVTFHNFGFGAQVGRMFQGCTGLQSVNFIDCDLDSVSNSNTSTTFTGCSSLTTIGVSNTSFSNTFMTNLNDVSTLNTLKFIGPMTSGTSVSDILSTLPKVTTLNITGSPNTAESAYALNTLPIDLSIVSDGTAYVSEITSGEWSYTPAAGAAQTDLTAEDVNALITEGKLPAGTFVKTGLGNVEVDGTMDDNVSWELKDGKLRIFPTDSTLPATLPNAIAGYEWPWATYAAAVKEVVVEDTVTANTNMVNLFQGCVKLTTVDVSGLDVSGCSNLSGMFAECASLENLALSFAKNTYSGRMTINRMFQNCTNLKSLDLSGASTYFYNLADGVNRNTFTGCTALEELNLSDIYLGGNNSYSFSVGSGTTARTVYYHLDLSKLSSLKTIVLDDAQNGQNVELLLPEGDWRLADGTLLSSQPSDDTPRRIRYTIPSGSERTITKTQDIAAGIEKLADTFYVIDNLSDFTLSITGYTDEAIKALTNGQRLTSGAYVVEKNGDDYKIYTKEKGNADWVTGATGKNAVGEAAYIHDIANGAPDVTITYHNAALDVNGERHDVVVKVDKFAFSNPSWVNASTYRRYLLTVGPSVLTFRNWVYSTEYVNLGNQGSGTDTNASIKIDGGTDDQTFLFYVGDLDVGRRKEGSGTTEYYEPGMEGIILGDGFDLDTLTMAEETFLQSYEWDDAQKEYVLKTDRTNEGPFGNYIIGTQTDVPNNTTRGRFYISGTASGASFDWTSGVNCDTEFLETTRAIEVWDPLPPVSVQLKAQKSFNATALENGPFTFSLTPTSTSAYEPRPANVTLNVTGGSTATITFDEMSFALLRDANNNIIYNPIGTHLYTLKEVTGTDAGIEYDTREIPVRIVIEGAINDLDAQTLGYTMKVYVGEGDAEALILTTHSRMEVTYGTAKKAASGAINAVFLSKTFTDPDTGQQYKYDDTQGAWINQTTDAVGDPPSDATATLWDESENRVAQSGVTFLNRARTVGVNICKIVSGKLGNKAKDWSFSITLRNKGGQPITDLAAPDQVQNWNDAGKAQGIYTFTLQHGDALSFTGLPYGAQYTVAETNKGDYIATITVTGDTECTKNESAASVTDTSLTDTADLVFKNELDPDAPTGIANDLAPVYVSLGIVGLLMAVLALTRRKWHGRGAV